ncbi:hypothetical protein CDL12_25836 [Handroanthus impetiginosus]|uniref:Uncharacterized protein n=1 Tax=Handroanthus impetiginosus TaxID=429701 RepID=A0A2G9G8N1_9LAMI|nr:hypothetical protein CDL12_25836 [Handroanthus impetiginosus]
MKLSIISIMPTHPPPLGKKNEAKRKEDQSERCPLDDKSLGTSSKPTCPGTKSEVHMLFWLFYNKVKTKDISISINYGGITMFFINFLTCSEMLHLVTLIKKCHIGTHF